MENIIEIKDVSLKLKTSNKKDINILKNFSLEIKRNEFVSILGPSGCGKTTALRIISGLTTPQKGSVRINNEIVCKKGASITPPEKLGIGVVFQDFALFPHLTVEKNIAFGFNNISKKNIAKAVQNALDAVDMSKYAKSYPSELSGGQQQRISLARAIAPSPSLVLLDEPFSHLDTRLKESIRNKTLQAIRSVGAIGILVTHDAEEAMFMSDKIVMMNNGSICQKGTPEELYTNPNCPYVANFFGEVATFKSVVKNNKIDTPVGIVNNVNFEENQKVKVLIRPEGIHLKLKPCNCCKEVSIVESHMLGMTSLIYIACRNSPQCTELNAYSRMMGVFLPKPHTPAWVKLDPKYTFIFKDNS